MLTGQSTTPGFFTRLGNSGRACLVGIRCESRNSKPGALPDATACNAERLEFRADRGRRVEGAFDAGRVTSDGSIALLREMVSLRHVARCAPLWRLTGWCECAYQAL